MELSQFNLDNLFNSNVDKWPTENGEYKDFTHIKDKNVFTEFALIDKPISIDEITQGLQKRRDADLGRLPLMQPNLFIFGPTYPYRISIELKSELLSRVHTIPAEIPIHLATDDDQIHIPDEPKKLKTLEIKELLEPDPDAKWLSLHRDSTALYNNFLEERQLEELQTEESKLYAQFRNPEVSIKDNKIQSEIAHLKLKKLQKSRDDEQDDWKTTLDGEFISYLKETKGKHLITEIENLSWAPPDATKPPILQKGGIHFQEWEQDLHENFGDMIAKDESKTEQT